MHTKGGFTHSATRLTTDRIVFATMHKFDGESRRPLLPGEVKQIAGRAGRYSSGHPGALLAI